MYTHSDTHREKENQMRGGDDEVPLEHSSSSSSISFRVGTQPNRFISIKKKAELGGALSQNELLHYKPNS
jgi:hypothetical protein